MARTASSGDSSTVVRYFERAPVLPMASAIAAAALARTAGGSWVEAATVANLAGNAKVRKLGVVPVNRAEIETVWSLGADLAREENGG